MNRAIASAVVLLVCVAAIACEEEKKPPYVQAQYYRDYLGSRPLRQRVGSLSESLGKGDFYGYCSAISSGDTKTISVLVADPSGWPNPSWKVQFHRMAWPEGSVASITCDHVEICDDTVCNKDLDCTGDPLTGCQITVSRAEGLKNAVQIWFNCVDFDTDAWTGGVPNKMSIEEGAMQIEHCVGF